MTASPWARVAGISVGLGAGFGVFLGVAQTLQFGTGLSRFGGMEYVPRVIALTTVRALGAGAAMLVTGVSAAIVLHRLGRRRPLAVERGPRALWLAVGSLATFTSVCVFTMLGGALTASAAFGASVRSFLAQGLTTLSSQDLAHGAALAAADALVVTALVPLGSRWLTSQRRGLVLKLLLAYAAAQATAFAEQSFLALLER
jgi:ABC-type transporter Mla maintaining outer membrane lipid asymmetry permease subunit MlaE